MDFQDIDITKIQFTYFQKKYTKQSLLYPNINNKSIVFKTPWILINQHGLQRINNYYPTDSTRNFIKIPHQDENKDFYDFLKKLDTYLENNKDKIITKGYKGDYKPLIKENSNKKYKDYTTFSTIISISWSSNWFRPCK